MVFRYLCLWPISNAFFTRQGDLWRPILVIRGTRFFGTLLRWAISLCYANWFAFKMLCYICNFVKQFLIADFCILVSHFKYKYKLRINFTVLSLWMICLMVSNRQTHVVFNNTRQDNARRCNVKANNILIYWWVIDNGLDWTSWHYLMWFKMALIRDRMYFRAHRNMKRL